MVKEKLPQKIYNVLGKSYETFYQVVFYGACKSYGITPIGFDVKKTSCVGKLSKNVLFLWEKELTAA